MTVSTAANFNGARLRAAGGVCFVFLSCFALLHFKSIVVPVLKAPKLGLVNHDLDDHCFNMGMGQKLLLHIITVPDLGEESFIILW